MNSEISATVLTVWWFFLGVALIVTLINVALLVQLIHSALRIKYLANRALPSAVKIVEHTAAIKKLEATNTVARDILSTAQSVVGAAASIEQKLDALVKSLARRGG